MSETIPHGVHLVGIGGMHMSAIARILLARGHAVSGSDLRPTPLTDALAALGARIAEGHAAANLGDAALVVTTAAASADNPELKAARRRGIPVIKRAEMVARLMAGRIGVAVAGCHGKSTTSGLVAYILSAAGRDPTYLIGAEVTALGDNAGAGAGPHVVVEADEYDRAFLSYHPEVALVTNVEADHLDYYGSWEAVKEAFAGFVANVPRGGRLILCADDAEALALRAHAAGGVDVVTYGIEGGDWRATAIETDGLSQAFDVDHDGERFGRFSIALPIRHNVQNALGAIVVCAALGLSAAAIAPALGSYTGVRRRFERRGEAAGVLVYDDYAHHPTEIADTAAAVRLHFPGRRSVALFQPHTYARSRYLLPAFRTCFRDFDRLFILETYAAREAVADGLTAAQLAAEIESPAPTCVAGFEAAADLVVAELRPGDVFFTVGAGDVDTVVPLVLERLRAREGLETMSFQPVAEVKRSADALFDQQKRRLQELIPRSDIQHIGSTAVDGSLTKSDLDINVRVQSEDFEDATRALRTIFEVNQPQNWSECFASFKDDDSFALPLGVQLTVINSDDDDFIVLRDFLTAHPELVLRVNKMKLRHDRGDVNLYRAEKSRLYDELKASARNAS